MADATTADKALDLADKWAQQIGEKMTSVAPGAADIASEAVVVKIVSAVIQWGMSIVGVIVCIIFARWLVKQTIQFRTEDRYGNKDYSGEAVPLFIGAGVTAFVGVFMFIGVMVNFPSREIAGIFAPRGYIALMMFESVVEKKKQ